jgi:transcription initiation factor TFIID subunit 8
MNASFVQQSERLVVAQICSRFDTVSIAAADAIAEVLSRFLLELGRTSQGYAELAGRTDVNASDVFCALNNLGTTFSQVMQDAENFEIPFAHTLPPRLHIRRLPKVRFCVLSGDMVL